MEALEGRTDSDVPPAFEDEYGFAFRLRRSWWARWCAWWHGLMTYSMSNGRWTLERWLLIATLVCSASAFIFGIGVQWAKTTAIEASVNALQDDYVRRDVYTADQRRLSEAIDRLVVTMDKLVARTP